MMQLPRNLVRLLIISSVFLPQAVFAASVSSVSPTGDPYLDGMLTGTKWASLNQSFSAPADPSLYGVNYSSSNEPANNFKAFTAAQLPAVRYTLAQHSAVSGLVYTELTESPTTSAVLRYAESDSPGTAWGYYPSTAGVGGDAWFNNSTHYYDNPQKGNYAESIIMHETGHTVGFKHPHEASGSFAPMPADRDSVEYSVMSYHSYIGSAIGAYSIGSGSYPQSIQMYDIAALQNDYGANFTTHAGNDVYKWSATTGETFINDIGQGAPVSNVVFLTIWDGGGHDTYDASNYTTPVSIDLQPGHYSILSTAQLASLGNGNYAHGSVFNSLLYKNNPASLIEDAIGGSGNDTLTGNAGDNTLTGGPGNDTIDGGTGSNTAAYSGLSTDYSTTQNGDGSWTIVDKRTGSPDGTDTLKNIQVVKYSDKSTTIGTVTAVNRPPVAVNYTYAVDENTTLNISATAGVLVNDSDPDGNALTAIAVSQPTHGSLNMSSNGAFTYIPTANYFGTDSFTYKANDGSLDSNIATVTVNVQQVVTPDTIAPTTSIDSPVTGATVSGTASVSASATDNVGVTQVQFFKDGSLVATDSAAPFTWSWPTTGSPNGTYTLTTTAYDIAGNTGSSQPVSVTVQNAAADTNPPTASVTAPSSGTTVPRGKVVTILAAASDDVGVTKVVFYVNGSATCTVTSSNYSCGWRVPNSPNKSYTLTTSAYDAAGNTGKSAPVTITSTR